MYMWAKLLQSSALLLSSAPLAPQRFRRSQQPSQMHRLKIYRAFSGKKTCLYAHMLLTLICFIPELFAGCHSWHWWIGQQRNCVVRKLPTFSCLFLAAGFQHSQLQVEPYFFLYGQNELPCITRSPLGSTACTRRHKLKAFMDNVSAGHE